MALRALSTEILSGNDVEIESRHTQFPAKLPARLFVDGSIQELSQTDNPLTKLHFDRQAIGILQYFVCESQVFRHAGVIFEIQGFTSSWKVVEQAFVLRCANTLFNDPVEQSHGRILSNSVFPAYWLLAHWSGSAKMPGQRRITL